MAERSLTSGLSFVRTIVLRWRAALITPFGQALALAAVLALGWWVLALAVRGSGVRVLVWDDQVSTFTAANLSHPYSVPGFVNPPWTMVFLAPLRLLPLEGAVLTQMLIYFLTLTALMQKFGRGQVRLAAAVALTSPLALDTALELNIDWLVCLGLLVPPAYSAPLLLVKPQNALGYLLSFNRRDLIRWLIVTLTVVLISFVVWGNWVQGWIDNTQSKLVVWAINVAPAALIGAPASLVIGALLAAAALRRRDPVWGILAGTCFVPYLAGYSAMLPFALIGARFPRAALLVSLALWLAVGLLFWPR